MKKLILISLIAALAGCADTSKVPTIVQTSPAGAVGMDLNSAAQKAMADYAAAKANGVDYLWALQEAFNSYGTIIKTQADVKALVDAWDGTSDQTLANRLAALFGASTGTTQERVAALAVAAMDAAKK